jgi:hypothetical protein
MMVLRFLVALCFAVTAYAQVYLKAKAWQAPDFAGYPDPEDFPEFTMLRGLPNTAVGFSGGGSRAYTCAVGQIAALYELGLIPSVKYLGGVSGGSWAVQSYSYIQNTDSDAELLGPVVEPEDITEDTLSMMDPKCMRSATNGGFPSTFMKWCWEHTCNPVSQFNDGWRGAVQKLYFDGRGIPENVRYSFNEETVADIKNRNPSLINEKFVTLADNRPFPIVTTTLIGPAAGSKYTNATFNFTRVEFTPLYTGDLCHWDVTYHYHDGKVHEFDYGGAVEPFAFGIGVSEAPAKGLEKGVEEDMLAVPIPDRIADVAYGAAMGSYAPGSMMVTIPFIDHETDWDANYWSPADPNPLARKYDWADGGVLENMPLLSFVQRGVERIVIFDNAEPPMYMSSQWDVEKEPLKPGMIDESFAAYFGWYPKFAKDAFLYNRAFEQRAYQIFDQEDYFGVVKALQAAQANGESPIASFELTTVENKVWRIKAGHKVKIIFAYLGRAPQWEDKLPQEIRDQVVPDKDPENLVNTIDHGKYKHFPHFATSGAELDYKQANLLADFTGWVVKSHEDMFREVLSD